MAKYRKEFKVTSMATYLEVSRSGFYDYVKRLRNPIGNLDIALIDFVKETWTSSKKSYGLIRILNKVK
jgi:hypothetical protein